MFKQSEALLMIRAINRTVTGEYILTLTIQNGDTLDAVRNEVNSLNKHYCAHGWIMLTRDRLIINNLPTFVFKFDTVTLPTKQGDDGVYNICSYKDSGLYVSI
jgi:hypothetical protein